MNRRRDQMRDRILTAAHELFVRQGVTATTVEEICERADVANRTFFNHYPTRQAMLEALAERLLADVHDIGFGDSTPSGPHQIVALFGRITLGITGSGDIPPDLLGALATTAAFRGPRGSRFHNTVVELIEDGVARGEMTSRHDPSILADIVVGALSSVIARRAMGPRSILTKRIHDVGAALAQLLAQVALANDPACQPPSVTGR